MRRITEKWLHCVVNGINKGMNRPIVPAVDHLYIQHTATGYSLWEQKTESGASQVIVECFSAKEMQIFLEGMMVGIATKNDKHSTTP